MPAPLEGPVVEQAPGGLGRHDSTRPRRASSRLLKRLGLRAPVLLYPLPECCSLNHCEADSATTAVLVPAHPAATA